MRVSDKAEARSIAEFWRENFTYGEEGPANETMEGAALFAVAHAVLALAKAVEVGAADIASSVRQIVAGSASHHKGDAVGESRVWTPPATPSETP